MRLFAAAALASLLACDRLTSPDSGAGLELRIEGSSAAALDSGKLLVRGPTNRTVKITPGTTLPIDGLIPGTYTVALEGFDSGGVARFFQATGVNIMANQTTSLAPTVAQFA